MHRCRPGDRVGLGGSELTARPPETGVDGPFRICFVCSGNICRSPMAERVFQRYVTDAGLAAVVDVESAGTGPWHVGEGADRRAMAVLERRGYPHHKHRARQFRPSWFGSFDLVVALDLGHLHELRQMAPDEVSAARVKLLRSFDPDAHGELDVPDPYYGGSAGFGRCLAMMEAAFPGLLEEVRRQVAVR